MNASLRTRSLWLAAGLAAVLSAPAFAQPQAPAAPAAAPKAPAAAAAPKAPAAPQPGDEIVKQINELAPPKLDRDKVNSDPEARKEFEAARDKFMDDRSNLIAELLAKFPDHTKAAELAPSRWSMLMRAEKFDVLIAETGKLAARSDKFGTDAAFYNAMATCESVKWDLAKSLTALDAFTAKAPKDERGATILSELADNVQTAAQKKEIYARMSKDFPAARATKSAMGKLKQVEGLGKPFEFKFTDAITGKEVTNQSLKGKVLVIDFWATWCGPCVAEMPKMKELYAKYKDKGVEFVGISLDQPEDKGGLTKLKEFVAKNDLAWPQYYQGNFWQSEFSSSWGINSIPAIFVVDAEGNLASTSARGKLDVLIPELLAKAGGTK
jgi:thiol-disulfide isomerase/thioredoxin